MKKYKVAVEVTDIEFWEVEANNEDEAMDNYFDGDHVSTKIKQEEPLYAKKVGEK